MFFFLLQQPGQGCSLSTNYYGVVIKSGAIYQLIDSPMRKIWIQNPLNPPMLQTLFAWSRKLCYFQI